MVYKKYIFTLCLMLAGFSVLSAMDEDRQERSEDYLRMFCVAEGVEVSFGEEDDEDRKRFSRRLLASGWQKIEEEQEPFGEEDDEDRIRSLHHSAVHEWNKKRKRKRKQWQKNRILKIGKAVAPGEGYEIEDFKKLLLHQRACEIIRNQHQLEIGWIDGWTNDDSRKKIELSGWKIKNAFFEQPLSEFDGDFTLRTAQALLPICERMIELDGRPIDLDAQVNQYILEYRLPHLSDAQKKCLLRLGVIKQQPSFLQRCGQIFQEHPYATAFGLGTPVVAAFCAGMCAGWKLKAIAQRD